MTKVVITGAGGNIGLSLIKKHLASGDDIVAIVRPNSQRNQHIPLSEHIKIIECDLSMLCSLGIPQKGEIFYHLGWSGVNRELRNDPKIQLDNIQYTLDAVKLAKKMGCKKFIGAGSQAEYGPKNEVITSLTSTNPMTGYGIGKYAAGKFACILCNQLDLKYNWVRIFSVFGPNDGKDTMIMDSINKMKNNEPIDYTDANQLWEYIYCDDCANALYLIGQKGINMKTYNVSSGDTRKLRDYIMEMHQIIGSNSILNFGAINQGECVINLQTDITELKSDTGFEVSTSFEEGIKKILNS